MVKIEQYNPEFKKEWNAFLSTAINGNFLFDRDYMEYHADRFNDASLLIFNDNEIVSLFPANISEGRIYSYQGLTYGGILVNEKADILSTSAIFSAIMKHYSSNGNTELLYKQGPSYYHQKSFYDEEYVLFLLGAELTRRDVASVIDLSNNLEYQERRNRGIKKSVKSGTIIKESFSCDEFWNNVLAPNLKERYNLLPVHSVAEMNLLMSRFPNNIRMYSTYLHGEITGGVVLFDNPTCVHAQYIAATPAGKQANVLDHLFDHVIRQAKEAGKKYFSFGVSNENNGLFLNKGLYEWKAGFGARAYSNNFYRITTSNYNKLESVIA
ncbi:MAG: GNAT family N-acetyltransferase [Bacteroidia bacterium]|nr:GNAT family N-acetyltransferase [Bacteroidia bacterium]